LSKSRRWSTTFKALREAREQHVRELLISGRYGADSQRVLAQLDPGQRISRFEFAGVGHLTTADAYLAAQAAAQARERRRLAREELRRCAVEHPRRGRRKGAGEACT
jgi:phosphohistidine phosphatase SixA